MTANEHQRSELSQLLILVEKDYGPLTSDCVLCPPKFAGACTIVPAHVFLIRQYIWCTRERAINNAIFGVCECLYFVHLTRSKIHRRRRFHIMHLSLAFPGLTRPRDTPGETPGTWGEWCIFDSFFAPRGRDIVWFWKRTCQTPGICSTLVSGGTSLSKWNEVGITPSTRVFFSLYL